MKARGAWTKETTGELWNCFESLASEIIYVSFRELQLNSINRLRGDISRLILLASKKCAPLKWNALFLRTNNGPNINMQAHPIVLGLAGTWAKIDMTMCLRWECLKRLESRLNNRHEITADH